ncbi:MAG TPA: SagB/ThcOx family dehydrogenase [Phycisphaerae bacterium]|nr:SagB/ThcOx family dehydrogenase [Phycisphaerae bacterium]
MTLLHDYQHGTAYARGAMPARDPHWQKSVGLYKSYVEKGAPMVSLERPATWPEADLWETLRTRRSHRDFAGAPMAQQTLMLLLWAAQGITQPGHWPFRTAPSAGALYPVETYVCAARVDGLEPGVYHWELPEERLALVAARDDAAAAAQAACLDQGMVGQAPVSFLWSGVWGRGAQKYGDRALRYVYLDAGHLAENLHLAATALGHGACMIGAFLDEEMNALAGVDGEEESVVYAACVGTPRG